MSLPDRTTVLVVGAGPSGLACAISLIKEGVHDITVVDALLQGENTSRALVIHAATLEALDTVQCAEPLIERGVTGTTMRLRERTSPLLSIDFGCLARYTRYPFGLLLPQNITEHVLTEILENLGVKVFRPCTVTGMKANERDERVIDVSFDYGHIICARYVVGADGAKSTVRQSAGIGFADPDGLTDKDTNNLSQMVIADVRFTPDLIPPMSTTEMEGVVSLNSFFIFVPLTSSTIEYQGFDKVYRFACGVPMSSGTPPHAPPTAYLQDLVDKYGPAELCSDPSANPHPVNISHTLWSTRFRTHSAIADRFFMRFGRDNPAKDKSDTEDGGVILLVGDAAHIHSPAGGQGMNLGLRDAISLGPTIAAHINQSRSGASDAVLQEYASVRRSRALTVIGMTKTMINAMGAPAASKWFWWLPVNLGTMRNAIFRILGKLQIVRNMAAWRLSGLGLR